MSTGDLLRHEVMSGSARGRQLYQVMTEGKLAPNAVVDDLLAEAMVNKKDSKVRIWKILVFEDITLKLNWLFDCF